MPLAKSTFVPYIDFAAGGAKRKKDVLNKIDRKERGQRRHQPSPPPHPRSPSSIPLSLPLALKGYRNRGTANTKSKHRNWSESPLVTAWGAMGRRMHCPPQGLPGLTPLCWVARFNTTIRGLSWNSLGISTKWTQKKTNKSNKFVVFIDQSLFTFQTRVKMKRCIL